MGVQIKRENENMECAIQSESESTIDFGDENKKNLSISNELIPVIDLDRERQRFEKTILQVGILKYRCVL